MTIELLRYKFGVGVVEESHSSSNLPGFLGFPDIDRLINILLSSYREGPIVYATNTWEIGLSSIINLNDCVFSIIFIS